HSRPAVPESDGRAAPHVPADPALIRARAGSSGRRADRRTAPRAGDAVPCERVPPPVLGTPAVAQSPMMRSPPGPGVPFVRTLSEIAIGYERSFRVRTRTRKPPIGGGNR